MLKDRLAVVDNCLINLGYLMKFPLICRRIEIRGFFHGQGLGNVWSTKGVEALRPFPMHFFNILCFLPSVGHSSKLINQSRGCGNPVHTQCSRKANKVIVGSVLGTKSAAWYQPQVDSVQTELNEKTHLLRCLGENFTYLSSQKYFMS